MTLFSVPISVIYNEIVEVEADTPEQARAMVEADEFSVNDASEWTHDHDPIIKVSGDIERVDNVHD